MTPAETVRPLTETAIALAQLCLCVGMFCSGLERSGRGDARSFARVSGLLLFAMVTSVFVFARTRLDQLPSTLASAAATTAYWCAILVILAVVLSATMRVDILQALFLCLCGYVTQNLASSSADFLETIIARGPTAGVPLAPTVAIELVCGAVAIAAAWRLMVIPIRQHGLEIPHERFTVALLVLVFLAVIFFDVLNKALTEAETPLDLVLALRVVHGIVCVAVLDGAYGLLVGSHLREEAAAADALLAAERRQYAQSKENIEAINIKCHDIRHQIRELSAGGAAVDGAVLADIAHEVSIYDSRVQTGNDALDTILSEKGLVCEREGIAFSRICDGTALAFMAPADIYSLFGNALDNAIEASRRVPQGQRSISLVVREAAGMASIHVENRFAGGLALGEDGLPRTSKGDERNHGFGTRSMRHVAERYDGTMAVRVVGDVFHLNVMLPVPEAGTPGAE